MDLVPEAMKLSGSDPKLMTKEVIIGFLLLEADEDAECDDEEAEGETITSQVDAGCNIEATVLCLTGSGKR